MAFGGAVIVSLLIASGWVYSTGYLDYGTPVVAESSIKKEEIKKVAPAPLANASSSFDSIFAQISEQYDALKASVASVFVPFITGIDVYNKGDIK
jgi:hypothetical protein